MSNGLERTLDVGELQNLGKDGRGEQGGVLDNDLPINSVLADDVFSTSTYEVSLIIERDANLLQDLMSRLSHHHGAHKLSTDPRTSTRRHAGLKYCDSELRPGFRERIRTRQTGTARTNDDHVGDGRLIHVVAVSLGHGSADLPLFDRGELVIALPIDHRGGIGIDVREIVGAADIA